MANHRKTETAARLKKLYSTFANAVELAELEQGLPASEWDYNKADDLFFNEYLAKFINYTNGNYEYDEPSNFNFLGYYNIHIADGSIVGLEISGSPPNSVQNFYFDINGYKGPNEFGRDRFVFSIYSKKYSDEKNISPYSFDAGGLDDIECYITNNSCSRDELIEECKSSGHKCTKLIMNDGWEIKDDYPHKL